MTNKNHTPLTAEEQDLADRVRDTIDEMGRNPAVINMLAEMYIDFKNAQVGEGHFEGHAPKSEIEAFGFIMLTALSLMANQP